MPTGDADPPGERPGARRPFAVEESFPVWLLAQLGTGALWLLGRTAFRRARERGVYRSMLEELCRDTVDPGQATAAVAEINRFLADPPAYAPDGVPRSRAATTGLAGPHVAHALHAQALAARQDQAGAANAMQTALDHLVREAGPDERFPLAFERRSAQRPTPAEEQERLARRELATLARAFIDRANGFAGHPPDGGGKRPIDRACEDHPALPYLYDQRAEILAGEQDYGGALDALFRFAVLRGAATSLDDRATIANRAASIALLAASPERPSDARQAGDELLRRADSWFRDLAAEQAAASPAPRDDERRAVFAFWRSRVLLRRAERLIEREPPDREAARDLCDRAAQVIAGIGELLGARAADTADNARSWLDLTRAHVDLQASPTGIVWRGVPEAILRSDGIGAPLLGRAREQLGAARARAGMPAAPPQRAVITFPASLLPRHDDSAFAALIGTAAEADADAAEDGPPTVNRLRGLLATAYGVRAPAVLLRELPDEAGGLIRLSLDGVPIGAGEAPRQRVSPGPAGGAGEAPRQRVSLGPAGGADHAPLVLTRTFFPADDYVRWRGAPDWFGASVLVRKPGTEGSPDASPPPVGVHPPATAIVLLLATLLVRHLDLLVDWEDAAMLGVGDLPYAAWSPTLRMLLADRTPLTNRAALREAVEAVASGAARPIEAAERYRRRLNAARSPWGAGAGHADLNPPEELVRPIARALRPSNDLAAAAIPPGAARDLERWLGEAMAALPEHAPWPRLVVAEPGLRPWLRLLLRRSFPDLPVLAPGEVGGG